MAQDGSMTAQDQLILVDDQDVERGHADKETCHDGEGLLHRAFSVFLFNGRGELLLQQRSAGKRLWPLFWSNTCCSHPRRGEAVEAAAPRRVREELGFDSPPLRFLFKFQYHAQYEAKGAERELCWVLIGRSDARPVVDPAEIADWRYVAPEALGRELHEHPERFTPWFKLEWRRIREEHPDVLSAL